MNPKVKESFQQCLVASVFSRKFVFCSFLVVHKDCHCCPFGCGSWQMEVDKVVKTIIFLNEFHL